MSALGMAGTAAGRVLSSCLAGSREGGRSDLEEAGRERKNPWPGRGRSVCGRDQKRREALSSFLLSFQAPSLAGMPLERGFGSRAGHAWGRG